MTRKLALLERNELPHPITPLIKEEHNSEDIIMTEDNNYKPILLTYNFMKRKNESPLHSSVETFLSDSQYNSEHNMLSFSIEDVLVSNECPSRESL